MISLRQFTFGNVTGASRSLRQFAFCNVTCASRSLRQFTFCNAKHWERPPHPFPLRPLGPPEPNIIYATCPPLHPPYNVQSTKCVAPRGKPTGFPAGFRVAYIILYVQTGFRPKIIELLE